MSLKKKYGELKKSLKSLSDKGNTIEDISAEIELLEERMDLQIALVKSRGMKWNGVWFSLGLIAGSVGTFLVMYYMILPLLLTA